MRLSSGADSGPGGVILDSTLTGTVTGLDESHVSLVSPAGSPRVLHDPEVLVGGRVSSVSDNEGGVIEAGSAGTVEDSGFVGLESESFGVNTDGKRLNGSSSLHGGDVVGGGGTLGNGDKSGGLSLVVGAGTSGSGVRVVALSHGLGGSVQVVVVSPGGETSIAGLVLEELVVAIEELLLGERGEGVSLDFPVTFEASSGGEGPARTTLSLVLDRGDGTHGSPVDGGRSLDSSEAGVGNVSLGAGLGSSEESLVLLVGPGGHFVVSEGVVVLSSVVLLDLDVHGLEVGESEVVLLNGSVGKTELGNMSEEVSVGGDDSSEEGGGKEFHLNEKDVLLL